jgi:hypothetical protein
VRLAQLMDRGDIGVLDLERVAEALPQDGEPAGRGGRGAQEQDGDLDPGRVLGAVELAGRGVAQPLPDPDAGAQRPAHQGRLGTGTLGRIVLGSVIRRRGRCSPTPEGQFLFFLLEPRTYEPIIDAPGNS